MNVIRITTGRASMARCHKKQVFRKIDAPISISAGPETCGRNHSWMHLVGHIQIALQENSHTIVSNTGFSKRGVELSFDREGI